jgi:DNA-binding transcriptional LysR family regulator
MPPHHRLAAQATVTLADLAHEAWVLREPGSASRHAAEQALRAHQVPWQLRLALPSNEAIKQAVMAGVGIGMVSRLAVTLEAQEGRLRIVAVRDFQVERQLSIVQRKDARLPAPAAAFLNLLDQSR